MKWCDVKRPVRATNHCRHYEYTFGLHDMGPKCAKGVDQTHGVEACMPGTTSICPLREDYSDAERAAWQEYTNKSLAQGVFRFESISCPIGRNSGQTFPCNCGHGDVHVGRGDKRAYINCSCGLGEVQVNIGHSGTWPPVKDKS